MKRGHKNREMISTSDQSFFTNFSAEYLRMKNTSIYLFSLFISLTSFSQMRVSSDEETIRRIMNDQVEAWNKGSVEQFMNGYWQDDSLMFISSSGVTHGYGNALRRYQDTYAGADKMGKLFFTLLKLQPLSGEYYFVTGKWFLKRKVGDIGGYFTLLFRKIDGHWRIIVDHTS